MADLLGRFRMRECGLEHLHKHTDFSCLDGVAQVEEYAELSGKINQKYLCVTDHGMMGVIPRQINACEKANLKPIFGCELYVNAINCTKENIKELSPEDQKAAFTCYHLLALATNNVGFSNLVALSSWAHLNGFYRKPRVTHEMLVKHREGILFTSCCYMSEIGQAFDQGGEPAGEEMLLKYLAMFPGQFRLEIMLLDFHKQKPYDVFILKMAAKYGLQVIITGDCHYAKAQHARIQRDMLLVRSKKTVRMVEALREQGGEDAFELQDQNLYQKSEHEMDLKYVADYSDAIPLEVYEAAKEETVRVARMCEGVELDRTVKLPMIPDADEKLREYIAIGLKERGIYDMPNREEYKKRIAHEYNLIKRKGFSSYFLINKMFTDEARRVCFELTGYDSECAVGPARGSGAAALTNYLLGVTDCDPLEDDLLFDRFLNENRGGREIKWKRTGTPLPGPLEDE